VALSSNERAPHDLDGHRCQRPPGDERRREVQLTYFHDGPDPILIASNFGGEKHPGWYYNLKANPECRFGGEDFRASEVTDSAEHARLYALAQQVYAGYGDYLAKTASYGRRIPLFRLRAAL
jgi:deazaflavin-dependent oxidoreductase (nitroreductase family)